MFLSFQICLFLAEGYVSLYCGLYKCLLCSYAEHGQETSAINRFVKINFNPVVLTPNIEEQGLEKEGR
jgi:hypothetical protein